MSCYKPETEPTIKDFFRIFERQNSLMVEMKGNMETMKRVLVNTQRDLAALEKNEEIVTLGDSAALAEYKLVTKNLTAQNESLTTQLKSEKEKNANLNRLLNQFVINVQQATKNS
eukprot:snap_masked-scaffold_20-processed-gene-2.23-mRNA-1 protein AED:1.00 eAED:1.00 QI:0/0/0/0/1/1/3/0/114